MGNDQHRHEVERYKAQDPAEDRTLRALREAVEWIKKENRDWWPFKPPWRRPRKPDPKKPLAGESKKPKEKQKEKELVDA